MSTSETFAANKDFLDDYIENARQQFDGAQIECAAQRLRERLHRTQVGPSTMLKWLSLASAALVLFAVLTLITPLLPLQSTSAFAQVQQWFSSFRTLQVQTVVQVGQIRGPTLDVWLNDVGDARIEANGVVTIVKSETNMSYTLLPNGQAIASAIPAPSDNEDPTEWLTAIRNFQGDAELLEESQVVQGVSASGYRLVVEGGIFVLWVDPSDNKPLHVETQMPGGAIIRNDLYFDVQIPTDMFDVPDDAL